jgi:UDP-glucose 4-epimerase
MRRVLLTGHQGKIGRAVAPALAAAGYEAVGYDAVWGQDLRDGDALSEAARGCRYVVHLAAIPRDGLRPPEDIMAANVYGTFNVLAAAEVCGAERVVFASSIHALGVLSRGPDYLPLDDDHPTYPRTAYAVSKRLGEEMCRAFTIAHGVPTVCLRPGWVLTPEERDQMGGLRDQRGPWGHRVWIDVRDVASAAVHALECPDPGHVCLLLAADDAAGDRPSRAIAEELGVPWREAGGNLRPFQSLVDTRRAREVLGWEPRHRWAEA